MKKQIKDAIRRVPGIRNLLAPLRLAKIRLVCFCYDIFLDAKYVGWNHNRGDPYWRLSSQLIFYHHKLEKGLCLPKESWRFFGEEAAKQTFRILMEWQEAGFDTRAPVFLASLDVLRAWRRRLQLLPPPEPFRTQVDFELARFGADVDVESEYQTPIAIRHTPADAALALRRIVESRRSVRNFDAQPVDFSLVEQAVRVAQLSPSACNRQPCKLHFYDDPKAISKLLSYQNGNSGFSHTIPLLAILTVDQGSFFDASERAEPALDGGLFLMTFILALQSLGLSSCCLNWCVHPRTDIQGHIAAQIPEHEKVLTFLAIGRARDDAVTPLSARRPIDDVIVFHPVHHAPR